MGIFALQTVKAGGGEGEDLSGGGAGMMLRYCFAPLRGGGAVNFFY